MDFLSTLFIISLLFFGNGAAQQANKDIAPSQKDAIIYRKDKPANSYVVTQDAKKIDSSENIAPSSIHPNLISDEEPSIVRSFQIHDTPRFIKLSLLDKKTNPNQTLEYRFFSDNENGCGRFRGMYCVLQIVSLSSGEIIYESRSPEMPVKKPIQWQDDTHILNESLVGEAYYYNETYSLYSIEDFSNREIASVKSQAIGGKIIYSKNRQYLFDLSSLNRELNIYELINTNSDEKLYLCESEECYPDINDTYPNPSQVNLKKTLKSSNNSSEFKINNVWEGFFFSYGGTDYQYIPETNEIITLPQ